MSTPEFDSEPAAPEVTEIDVREDLLIVKFADGHEMATRRNTGGFSPNNAIETFSLLLDAHAVAQYQSPYQYPRNTDSRNGFIFLQSGYSSAKVAEYWASADRHVRALVDEAGGLAELRSQNETMHDAFILLSHGHQDMLDVASGRAEVPAQ